MRIVFIGDIIGSGGRKALAKSILRITKEFQPDVVVANGENAAAGFGLTRAVYEEILDSGVNVITSGNHIWDKREIESWIDKEDRLVRPANMPCSAPGKGWTTVIAANKTVAVVNLQGRVMMSQIDCPFKMMKTILETLPPVDAVVVDFHAEATSEKEAFGRYFDGKVAAIVGTHTHVQTADEKILPGGTAYISDIGFTGGSAGVIGYKADDVLERFLKGIPRRLEPEDKNLVIMGAAVEIENKFATSIKRFQFQC